MDKFLAALKKELEGSGTIDAITTLPNPDGRIDAVIMINRSVPTCMGKWVTWCSHMDGEGNFAGLYWGNYHNGWEAAVIDYQQRLTGLFGIITRR